MKHGVLVRIVGVAAIVTAYGIFLNFNDGTVSLIIAILGILTIVAPDAVDKFSDSLPP
jgi:hypothetical protein